MILKIILYRSTARLLSRLYADFRPTKISKGRECNIIKWRDYKALQPALDYNSHP